MAFEPLPKQIDRLKAEIGTLRESVLHLEQPIVATTPAPQGSLLASLTASLNAIDDSEAQQQAADKRLETMRPMLSEAETALAELEKAHRRSKALYDSGMLAVATKMQAFNDAHDALKAAWDELHSSMNDVGSEAQQQTGAWPSITRHYSVEATWLEDLPIVVKHHGGLVAVTPNKAIDYGQPSA